MSSLNQKGLYLILVVALLAVLLGFCALVIGIGQLTIAKGRLQNIANIVALATVENITRSMHQENPPPPFTSRAAYAVARANEILQSNSLPGVGQLGTLSDTGSGGTSGKLTFGLWLLEADTTTPGRVCPDGAYPCFIEYNEARDSGLVTAVRINLHTEESNPLSIAFGRFVGYEWAHPSVSVTSALIQRCTAFLIDLSNSIIKETHKRPKLLVRSEGFSCTRDVDGTELAFCFDGASGMVIADGTTTILPHCRCVDTGSAFGCEAPGAPEPSVCDDFTSLADVHNWKAHMETRERPSGPNEGPVHQHAGSFALREAGTVGEPFALDEAVRMQPYQNAEFVYWANMINVRPDPDSTFNPYSATVSGFDDTFDQIVHYRSDYGSPIETPDAGTVYFDRLFIPGRYTGPQPYTRLMHAFNAGIRSLQNITTNADRSVILGFTGVERGRFPASGLSKDLGYFAQITNLFNRGMLDWQGIPIADKPQVFPNFIDEKLYPIPTTGIENRSTNLVRALHNAIDSLADQQYCPAEAKKQIILATDGVSTCQNDPNLSAQDNCLPNSAQSTWDNFVAAEAQLTDMGQQTSVIRRLIDSDIAVTVLLDGSNLNTNYIRRYTSPAPPVCQTSPNSPECFVSQEEAQARGINIFDTNNYHVSNLSVPVTNDQEVYDNLNSGEYLFGRAVEVMRKLSFNSGGFLCPMLENGPIGDYEDHDGDDDANGPECSETDTDATPCVLKSTVYGDGQVIRVSPLFQSREVQAAECTIKAIGTNPFVLVAE